MAAVNGVEAAAVKAQGARFWDANPCGGGWSAAKERLAWYLDTEPYLRRLLAPELLAGRRVLEVGCGQGMILFNTAAIAASAVGMDISEGSLRSAAGIRAQLGATNVDLLRGDAERLPFPDGAFDVVLCIGVLHHTPGTAAGIEEIRRILRPGGRAVVMLYRGRTPKALAVHAMRGLSLLIDGWTGRRGTLYTRLLERFRRRPESSQGTALLELFGCPVLKLYDRGRAVRFFDRFRKVESSCTQPGFERLLDMIPASLRWTPLRVLFRGLDRAAEASCGFYQVIRAEK